jgi:RNA polymerase sporulation-specific sigma factor
VTNEELAAAIQNGRAELVPRLWENVRRFVRRKAARRLLNAPAHLRDLEEDLINEGFFALIDAVSGFRGDGEASFVHCLDFHLKTAFNAALGMRSEKRMREPLHRAISLNAPVAGEADDLTLSDILIDPAAEEAFLAVDEEDYGRNLGAFLREAIGRTCAGAERDLMLAMLDHNASASAAGRLLGMDPKRIYGMRNKALRKIRRYMETAGRRVCDALDVGRCAGVGVNAWRNRGFTSVTEAEAVLRADIDLWRRRISNSDAEDPL